MYMLCVWFVCCVYVGWVWFSPRSCMSQIEKIVEVPVTIEKRVEVAVPYERVVHIEVPVEKIVYKDVPVPVQMTPERIVTKEIPQVCTGCEHHLRSLLQMHAACERRVWSVKNRCA